MFSLDSRILIRRPKVNIEAQEISNHMKHMFLESNFHAENWPISNFLLTLLWMEELLHQLKTMVYSILSRVDQPSFWCRIHSIFWC